MPISSIRKGLTEAGYRFSSKALCKGCQVPIEWWVTPQGKNMPMRVTLDEGCEVLTCHFADCESRQQFRRTEKNYKDRVEAKYKPRLKTGNLFE